MFHGVIQKITLAQFFETRCISRYEQWRSWTLFGSGKFMPNTHRRRRRDETVESRRVGGVYTNSQLVGDS